MAYPPQPGYPPPYQPVHPAMAPKPNGATAIVGAVLAILGGLYALARALIALPGLSTITHDHDLPRAVRALAVIEVSTSGLMMLLLIIGAVLVFARRRTGQWLVLAGSLFGIGLVVFSMLWVGVMNEGPVEALRAANTLSVFTVAVPSAATLVLIVLSPTSKYLKHVRNPPPPQSGYGQFAPGPQQQQWGQQAPRQW